MQGLHSALPRCTPAYVLSAPDGAYCCTLASAPDGAYCCTLASAPDGTYGCTLVILYLFIEGGFAVLDEFDVQALEQ